MESTKQSRTFLKRIENTLLILNILLVFILGIAIVHNYRQIQKATAQVTENQPAQTEAVVQTAFNDPEPFSTYESRFKERDLFALPQQTVIQENADTVSSSNAVSVTTSALPDHVKVVGIIVGKPSEIVIEDTQTQQTFFIQEGQAQGDFAMERVDNGRVIVSFRGQNFQIPLSQ